MVLPLLKEYIFRIQSYHFISPAVDESNLSLHMVIFLEYIDHIKITG
jgi:hypothetical protein